MTGWLGESPSVNSYPRSENSGSDYYNVFYSLVLLALVDTDYIFIWVNVGQVDLHQMYRFLTKAIYGSNIKDGPLLGLPLPEPLEGGANWHYFRLTDNAFALMPWMAKPYSIRQPTREERIANYRISKGRSLVKNAL